MSTFSPLRTAEPPAAGNRHSTKVVRPRVPRWLRHALRGALQLLGDTLAVAAAYYLAYLVRFRWGWWTARFPVVGVDPGWSTYGRLLYTLIPLWLGIFWYSAELYTRPWRPAADRFVYIVKGAILGLLATLTASYIYGRLEYSRLMLVAAVPLVVLGVSAAEELVLRLDAWIARFEATSPLLLVGGGRVAELLRDNLRARHPGMAIHEAERFADAQDLLRQARAAGAGEVIVIRTPLTHARILEAAEACESAEIHFKMIPDLLELRLGEIQMDDTLGLPAYRVQHTSLSTANYAVKRVLDLAAGLAALVVAGIPFAAIALLIRLDSRGPVFYRQRRLGYKGRPFDAYKFRTMVAGAEAGLPAVKALNDQKGGFFKAKEDPRVTRVGRWLRRFSLDELPQFINVFRGEMSVVGPRPLAEATGELEELLREFGPTARKRFNILPGITGLWQVSGRSDVSSQQRFALDLFYVEHWSPGLDLRIILKTLPAMISGKGAY